MYNMELENFLDLLTYKKLKPEDSSIRATVDHIIQSVV